MKVKRNNKVFRFRCSETDLKRLKTLQLYYENDGSEIVRQLIKAEYYKVNNKEKNNSIDNN